MVLNSKAQVQHLISGGHLTGSLYASGLKSVVPTELQKIPESENVGYELLRESHLFFFRLYRRGSGLSLLAKFCSVGNEALGSLMGLKSLREFRSLRVLFISNLAGLSWLLSGSVRRF